MVDICRVEYDADRGFVRAAMTGTLNCRIQDRLFREAVAAAPEQEARAFLIDLRDTKLRDNTLNIFEMFSNLDQSGLRLNRDRVAVVYAGDHDDHRFAETVAHNRGWVTFRCFDDVEAALDWLGVGDR